MEIDKKKYEQYVKKITPVHSLGAAMAKAFLVGGLICLLGQAMMEFMTGPLEMDKEAASTWTSVELVLLSVLLTGWNVYPKLVKFGGAGALVPITGFANAVASPALEFKTEGLVTGLASKLFIIAGPVLVFGTLSSVLYGLILCLFI